MGRYISQRNMGDDMTLIRELFRRATMQRKDKLRGGYFVFHPGTPLEQRIKNTLVQDGAEDILRMVFQNTAPFSADFHMGLTNASYTYTTATEANLSAEEPVGNGYARQQLTRNNTDWSVALVNNIMRVQSKLVTFTASAPWTKQYSRAFIIDDGTNRVLALSGPTPAAVTVLTGQGPPAQYELWLPE